MQGRRIAYRRSILTVSLIASLYCAGIARADIDIWYELVSTTGPGAGVVAITQGAAGQRLLVTLDSAAGDYELTIRCFAGVPLADAIIAYDIDLLAPTAANVEVTSLTYLGTFDGENLPHSLSVGPGPILESAGQLSFVTPEQSGVLTLFELKLKVTQPPTSTIEIYSRIGQGGWGYPVIFNADVFFADAAALPSDTPGGQSSTPSIVIGALGAAPPTDCDNNGTPDSQQIAANAALDCNNNGALDSCEITANPSLDCNSNGHLDNCETAANAALDCNVNGKLDACDLSTGASADQNVNGIPDECESTNANASNNNNQQQQQTNSSNSKVVDRVDLRKRLAFWFGIPIEGVDPLWLLPYKTVGFLGINVGAVWAAADLQSFPLRAILFELTYRLLDALLP